jgi:CspA family cold shock protein
MNLGVVKFFDETKGFGFIKGENGEEVFVHASGLINEIHDNDEVRYDTQMGKKGVNAINVKLA